MLWSKMVVGGVGGRGKRGGLRRKGWFDVGRVSLLYSLCFSCLPRPLHSIPVSVKVLLYVFILPNVIQKLGRHGISRRLSGYCVISIQSLTPQDNLHELQVNQFSQPWLTELAGWEAQQIWKGVKKVNSWPWPCTLFRFTCDPNVSTG